MDLSPIWRAQDQITASVKDVAENGIDALPQAVTDMMSAEVSLKLGVAVLRMEDEMAQSTLSILA